MKTRLIAGAVAVVLAATGTVLVLSYVRGADARAMSGLDTVEVLVAGAPIAAGTSGADLAGLVVTKQLPANAVLPNGVTSMDQLANTQALVALEPGEQLLAGKFGPPLTAKTDALVVPPEFQQVTILLELKQALGGQIKAGDTVGVFMSYTTNGVDQSQLTAHKVLVTRVQQLPNTDAVAGASSDGVASSASTAAASSPTTAPPAPSPTSLTESLLITVATTSAIAEKIVFTAEFGSIWLSDEPAHAVEDPTQVVDGTVVFK